MQKIRVMSDLHREFDRHFTIPSLEDDKDTILVVAGDIAPVTSNLVGRFLAGAGVQFKAVIFVFGNHEYYSGGILHRDELVVRQELEACGANNVYVLADSSVTIDGITFVGASLWTDFQHGDPLVMMTAMRYMNDYRSSFIQFGDGNKVNQLRKMMPQDVYKAHLHSRAYLRKATSEAVARGEKLVVVTHHGFSFQSEHARFKGNPYNCFFMSNLDTEVEEWGADIAIHGHVHNRFEYYVGKTRVIVNPKGYPGENPEFDPLLTVEI